VSTALAFTFWERLTEPRGRRIRTTWSALLARLAEPRVVPVKSNIPGLALATFRGDYRLLANVESVFAVGLDLDHLDALSVQTEREPGVVYEAHDLASVQRKFASCAAFAHTTWSSTLLAPRLRVFLLLSRPVTGDEYRRVYQAVAGNAERSGLVVDRAASDPSRLWYLPAVAALGRPCVYWTSDGAPIDVEAALASVPAPVAPPVPAAPTGPVGDVEARADKYLAKCEPAISGSGGHRTTFIAAQCLVRGFGLDEHTAYRLFARWNERCSPPWSEHELRRKLDQALKHGTMQEGELRDAPRPR
jgi:hypothetical protein